MTDFLFSMPGWIDGAMSLADISGGAAEYNSSESSGEADRRAFNADISALREDMAEAYAAVQAKYVK